MISKPKIEISFDNIRDLCIKLYQELQRYGATRQFVNYSIDLMDEDSLKDLRKTLQKRLEDLKRITLGLWDESSVEIYMKKLSPDALQVLNIIKSYNGITKKVLMEKTGFTQMKIAGLLAGMNNMARRMGKRPVVLRTSVRVNGKWDIEYRIDESFLNAMK
jgi:arsenate reductase-like glutaredoxin family protein